MDIITYGIHISGGIENLWAPWYLANISGAAFAIYPRSRPERCRWSSKMTLRPTKRSAKLLATLRRIDATASVPVVVLTAKELTISDREYLRGRITALIRKQGSQHQLVSVIEDLVARRRGG